MPDYLTGLNLETLDEMTPEEKQDRLMWSWRNRGPLYGLYATSLMLDYAPKFAKLHFRAVRFADLGDHQTLEDAHADLVLWSCHNIHSYMMYGWETGIHNEFNTLRNLGMGKDQVMELVMFSQLYAGMRGLGHVYRAVGDFLPAWGPPAEPLAVYPEGWAADPEGFKSGLDLSTRAMTAADLEHLTAWYESTIGYVPKSIQFGLKYHPEFVKVNRAKWEVAIRTLPKQMAPLLMIKHNAITQSVEGLRESVLLAKAWGVKKRYVLSTITGVVLYFAGFEGWYAPYEALQEILDDME